MKQSLTGLALSLLALSSAPILANPKTIQQAPDMESIVVTGTKTARQINEVAASITHIDSQQIDGLISANIRDLLRYEPGLSVEGSGRFGLSGFNIRGINGDRVLILIDGVPVADEFSFGPNLSSRRDLVDIDLLQSVDIVRGPASTLYGSDAIGGVVAFTTKQPVDFISGGQSFGGRIKAGYASQADESVVNGVLAGIYNDWQWLLNGTYRDGAQTETFFDDDLQGDMRQSADPQSNQSVSVLAKLIYQPSETHRVEWVAESATSDATTDLQSEVTQVVRGGLNLSSQGFDEQDRERLSVNYRYTPNNIGSLVRMNWLGFYQQANTEQHSELTRVSLAPNSSPFFRTRDSFFEQTSYGLHGQFDHQFSGWGQHYLIYGLSIEHTESSSVRKGQTQDTISGASLPEFSVFPARDFPISTLREQSLFIQDEIQLLDGKLRLSPGIRFDDFTLTPELDPIFVGANPGVVVAEFADRQFSKKLGAVYSLNPDYSIWLQYAEGFRVPPMDDVNVGFTNFRGRYTSLANPDLKPESVTSVELGFRGHFQSVMWSLSAYQNRYDDFIESLAFVGFAENGFTQFQAQNIDKVDIKGIEGQLTWYLEEAFTQAEDWQLMGSFSVQDSENRQTGQALESILPAQWVLGLQYQDHTAPWHLELTLTHGRQAKLLTDNDDNLFFRAPSYTTLDLLGHVQILPDLSVNFGVFNLTDKQYWMASEVRGLAASANVGRFTATGRNASANIILNF